MAVKAMVRHILVILSLSMILISTAAGSVRGQEAAAGDGTSSSESDDSAYAVQSIDLPGRVDDDVNLRSAPSATDDTYIPHTGAQRRLVGV